MNNRLQTMLLERVASKLERTGIVKPSEWAEKYRVMGSPFPGPWTFQRHPWLREMHDSQAISNIGKKAAQMGFTEVALNVCFFKMDMEGASCLYVMPNKTPDATEFTASRFNPALELSPYLRDFFSDVENVGHKRAGTTNLFVRGSKSASGLKSQPVSVVIKDEVAEFLQANIPMIEERMSGQPGQLMWSISTPTVRGKNIDKEYEQSTKELFNFKCPKCNRFIILSYPESLIVCGDDEHDPRVKESHIICTQCKNKLDHDQKMIFLQSGIWVPEHDQRDERGFHINQLYSSTVTPQKMSIVVHKSRRDPAIAQELHNSKLGMCHEEDGARVTEEELNQCIRNYMKGERNAEICTIGVDVGVRDLIYVVRGWKLPTMRRSTDLTIEATSTVLDFGKVEKYTQLEKILDRYRPLHTVIDANPERRKSLNLATRYHGYVKLCLYVEGRSGKDIGINEDQHMVHVDRTSWMDLALSRFRAKQIILPENITQEFKDEIMAPVRIYKKDQNENPVARYIHSDPDHYAHALTYSEIAFSCRKPTKQTEDIR